MARIFWLDDHVIVLHAIQQLFGNTQHQVLTFTSDQELIAALRENSLPDLIVQDLSRPSGGNWMTGWNLYEQVLRPNYPQIPVMIFSLSGFSANLKRADDYNLRFLHKDATSKEIFSAVNDLLSSQRSLHEAQNTVPYVATVDFSKVTDALIRHISMRPNDLYEVNWSTFEELVARLLQEMGYDVMRTPLTRDGGVDLWALQRSDLGEILYAIDTKKYAPSRIVGPEPVRAIYGVVAMQDVSVGMIVTTSRFGQGAREIANQHRYRIALKDFHDVMEWIRRVNGKLVT